MKRHLRVAVVGAGVSGLTCGVVLAEGGHDVTLFAAATQRTTSAVAAAIWYPYHIEPRARAEQWALASYHDFADLARRHGTGVSMVEFEVVGERRPRWTRHVPHRRLRRGFAVTVPLIETPVYLPWLRDRLRGRIHRRTIRDLHALTRDFDVVVNCSGLGARTLCRDPRVRPGRGVVLRTPNPGFARHYVEQHGDTITYVLTRAHDIILGGTDDERFDREIDTALTRAMHARCTAIAPTLPSRYRVAVGFRPVRDEVRLEREAAVIHNYGHGGAGFTVSWGCAREVAGLVGESA